MPNGRVVIAGASGMLGQATRRALERAGYEVVGLARSGRGMVSWDGRSVGPWAEALEGARAVVNYSGASVARRWNEKGRRLIRNSRVEPTRSIADALGAAFAPPPVWINASAVGYYGDTGARETSEASRPGTGFLAETCQAWEDALFSPELPSTRRVAMRMGSVLAREGGALDVLARLVRNFAGGAVGSGRQFMSWVHVADALSFVRWAIETEGAAGAFNLTSPNPVTNEEFMARLRRALGRPWSPPVPAWLVRMGSAVIGVEADLVLESSRVVPQRAQGMGFVFRYPLLSEALGDLYR